jgi:hypothetical protein
MHPDLNIARPDNLGTRRIPAQEINLPRKCIRLHPQVKFFRQDNFCRMGFRLHQNMNLPSN